MLFVFKRLFCILYKLKNNFFRVITIYEPYEQLVLPLEIKYVNIILYVP